MPFRQFASSFQPHELELLCSVFDDVWQKLSDIGMLPRQEELAAPLRQRLAQMIVVAARNGEWNPERLSEFALERISIAAIQADNRGIDAKVCRQNSTAGSEFGSKRNLAEGKRGL